MNKTLRSLLLIMMPIYMLIWVSGCDLTLGPKVATKYVVVHPGKPLQILSERPVVVPVRLLGEADPQVGARDQDVAGWVAMPKDHWDRIDDILKIHAEEKK